MKNIINSLLHTKVGHAVLAFFLNQFLKHLIDRAIRTHGSSGVILHDFLSKQETSMVRDFIDSHEVDQVTEHLVGDGVKDESKVKRFFKDLINPNESHDNEPDNA